MQAVKLKVNVESHRVTVNLPAEVPDGDAELVLLHEEKPAILVFTDWVRPEYRLKPLEAGNALLPEDYDDFFAAPGFTRQAMDSAVYDPATELRALDRLKTPDALHLAAAITVGCDEFWTNDQRLSRAAANRLDILTVDKL